ncbi:lipase, putative [Phytophthora infestans T30-4]|uniref:Carboxylic ester hydrolase n=1 Tax=Phytophthora infestans (strain T30-4) TaxID=403677 RepID=D0P2N7_PHYIT|nr:lipase, putative [Phytophthora infestans T30-4]EEY56697.1 lipase, putative [Phytophthora infestans T30-4]|eukprot:XP_002895440.1 lipase, putative [Phytophthora infestans T30-4]
MRSLLLPTTAVALFNTPITASDAPTAAVKNGSYFGVYQPAYDQDLFLGMPFAQPPVNSLRFRNPEPLNTTWTDIKNATEYSPECYGYGSDHNISEGDNLPVGVWIYGGGLTQGGARDPRYNLSYIVEEAVAAGKPFIGVSFNYRLQAFGFMSGTAVHKAGVANLALKDQRLALHWVQENIAAFGGNASEVTIWGESAGARSIGYQLIAYDGRNDGLFRSAVMQSGASAYWPKSFKNASAWDINYNSITDAANCSSAKDTLECLRHVPIDTLSAIFNSTAATSAMYAPSVDGDFLMDVGPKLIGEGKFVHVPILHGANCDEGTAFGKTGINTTEEFYEYLMWARDDVPVYSYRFNVVPAGVSQFLGSTHFTEVAFVFYNLEGNGYNTSVATDPFLNKPDNFKQLARIMTRMWASFIVDQTPNNNGVIDIEWPQYSLDDPQNIVFDANVTDLAYIEPDLFRAEAIAYIHSLYNATS